MERMAMITMRNVSKIRSQNSDDGKKACENRFIFPYRFPIPFWKMHLKLFYPSFREYILAIT